MPVVHNRGRRIGEKTIARKIIFPQGWDKDGHPLKEGKVILEETLLPGQHKTITEEQLKHLRANCPDEIINVEDIKDLQDQFKEVPAAAPREGYVAPDEVDAIVAKKVAEALAKVETKKPEKEPELDKMDRGDLIAFIEKEGLEIDHKTFKAPGTLQAAIATALENKKAAKSAA